MLLILVITFKPAISHPFLWSNGCHSTRLTADFAVFCSKKGHPLFLAAVRPKPFHSHNSLISTVVQSAPIEPTQSESRQPIKKDPFGPPYTTGVDSSDIGAAGFEPTTPTTPKYSRSAEIAVRESVSQMIQRGGDLLCDLLFRCFS